MRRPVRWAGRGAAGQAAPLMVVLLALSVAAMVVTAEVGQLLDESARARTAADAAALAGAAAGRDEAASVAAANGASLTAYRADPPSGTSGAVTVTVSVQVGRASRSASAEAVTEWVRPQE